VFVQELIAKETVKENDRGVRKCDL